MDSYKYIQRASDKTITVLLILIILLVIGSIVIPSAVPAAGDFISDAAGVHSIHPSYISGGIAIVISSLLLACTSLLVFRRNTPANTFEKINDIPGTKITAADKAQTDDGLPLAPEMQFALNAAFEKLKESRDNLDDEITRKTSELRDTLRASDEIIEAVPAPLYIFAHQPPDAFSLLTANPEAISRHGTDKDTIKEQSFDTLWPDINKGKLKNEFIKVMRTGETHSSDYQSFTDDYLEKSYRVKAFNISESRLGLIIEDNTEDAREKLENKRDYSQAKLYLDMIGSILLVLDRKGVVIQINDAGCKEIGLTRDEVLGKNWFERFIPEDLRGQVMISFDRVISGDIEPSSAYSHVVVSSDGELKTIKWHNICLTDALGQITGLLCSGEDVTEKRRIEKSLSESEKRLRTILDSVQTGILVIDPEEELVVDANPVAIELIQTSRDQLIGQAYDNYMAPNEDDVSSEIFTESGLNQRLLITTSGDMVPVIVTVAPVELNNKEYRLESIVDISERVATENALKQSEEEYRRLFENANEGIFIGQDGKIPFCNPKLEEVTGYSASELAEMPFKEMIFVEDRQMVVDNHLRRLAGEDINTVYSFRIVNKKGLLRWIEIRAVLIEWIGKPGTLNFITDITERMDAESQLKESESKYRLLTENLKDVVIKLSLSGIMDYVSPAIYEFGGYSPEEEIGQHIGKYFANKTELSRAMSLIRKVIADRAGESFEFVFQPKELPPFTVEVTGKPVIKDGKAASILCVFRDVSFRKKAEDNLRRNLAAMDAASDGMALLNEDGEYTYLNKSHLDIYGYEIPDELLGEHWQKLYSGEEGKRFEQDVMPGLEVDGFWQGEAIGKKKDGTFFPQEISLTLIDEKTLICVIRDITERKEAEQALRDSEIRFRSVIESVPNIAVQGYNPDKEVIFWNDASELLYGYSAEEAIGRKMDDLILPEFDKLEDEVVSLDLAPGEIAMRHKDGSIIPVYSSHMTLKNTMGSEEMYCLDVDLTALKRARQQQEILQEKLERAERMESLGILAGGVAHDLNNMLGPMVGYSDLLLTKIGADSPYRKQIMRIGQSAQDAADVIQDLLTLARRGRYEIVPTDLNGVVRGYLESPSFHQLTERYEGVTLDLQLDDTNPLILGSAPHLAKTIMNLIVNSFDAMAGNGCLKVTTEVRELDSLLSGYKRIVPNSYLMFRVKDTGLGISDEDMEKIFEPYYSKKKMGVSGSGLGLAVVYGIVKDHKGYYDVFSRRGEGTEFVLYFPITHDQVIEEEDAQADLRGTETILIIDDNPVQRQIASDLLSNLGYVAITAGNGREGVGFLNGNTVDLVIIDMIMENGYDGLDTFKDILAMHPHQKAIVISGFSATERVNEMQELGAGAYVRKPFTMDKLGRAVRAELDRQSVSDPVG